MSDRYQDAPPNKFGVTSLADLKRVERRTAAGRAAELGDHAYLRGETEFAEGFDPVWVDVLDLRAFDVDYLRAIHAYLFQDSYTWAGHLRENEYTAAFGISHASPETMRRRLPGY